MERHKGLVHAALQRFRMQKRVAIDDLMLAGLRGLEIGIDKWDPERGCLTTVACWYIRDHISKTYGRLQTAICVPATTLEQASQAASGAPPVVQIAAQVACSAPAQQYSGDATMHSLCMKRLQTMLQPRFSAAAPSACCLFMPALQPQGMLPLSSLPLPAAAVEQAAQG